MSQTISAETLNWFASHSPEQLEEMKVCITKLQLQAQHPQLLDPSHVRGPMRKKPKAAAARRGKTSKGGVQPPELIGAKRPLNSWMAFRAYYAPIFTSFQQKEISGFLTRMWHADPFHAKWTIAAKAYSVIRSKTTKSGAPLDAFLQVVCPRIGLISPAEYLYKLGWALNSERILDRLWTPTIADFSHEEQTTILSADDLVRACTDAGYVVEAISPAVTTAAVALTMAAQPATAENAIESLESASFTPETNDDGITSEGLAPTVEYQANSYVLAAAQDQYPYNAQFEVGVEMDPSLYYDVAGNDLFNSMNVADPGSLQDINVEGFGFEMADWVNDPFANYSVNG